MAWTAPKTWDETVVTAAMLNTYIRDEFLALDQHQHTGALGDGGNALDTGGSFSGETDMTLASNLTALTVTGQLKRQNDNLRAFTTTTTYLDIEGDAAIPSIRTLGTGATQAAAGNHTH